MPLRPSASPFFLLSLSLLPGTLLAQQASPEEEIMRPVVPWYLKRVYGLERIECRGLENLQASISAGHGVLLAPNHCRPGDPIVVTYLAGRLRQPIYTMASWHLFMQGAFRRWFIRRMGGFSVYREGMDRTAVSFAVKVLETAERPLLIFPEGAISRTNDVLFDLMAGTTFIARSAARKRAKASSGITSRTAG